MAWTRRSAVNRIEVRVALIGFGLAKYVLEIHGNAPGKMQSEQDASRTLLIHGARAALGRGHDKHGLVQTAKLSAKRAHRGSTAAFIER